MEIAEFQATVNDTLALLSALRVLLPKRVDPDLLTYLKNVQSDPAGLELLRAAIAPKPK